MASVRWPTSMASSHWLSGSIATHTHWGERSRRSIASASLTSPSLTALSRAKQLIALDLLDAYVVQDVSRKGFGAAPPRRPATAAPGSVDLEHARRASDAQAFGQAREDADDELDRPTLAMQERPEGLQKVAATSATQPLTPGTALGWPLARRLPHPTHPWYVQSGFGRNVSRCRPGGGAPAWARGGVAD